VVRLCLGYFILKQTYSFIFFICLTACANANEAIDKIPLTIYSELWPPFQQYENGKFSGKATRQVKATLAQANWPFKIMVSPWARALASVKETKNTMIYSISRTKQRELKFHWIARLGIVKTKLLIASKRKDIIINKLTDIKKYRIIIKRHDASSEYFYKLGFHPKKDIIYVNNSEQALELLQIGRADIYPIVESGLSPSVNKTDYNAKQFTFVYDLIDLNFELYLAANINSDPLMVEKLQQLFIEFKDSF
jgi:polar amino acid transport system substrate-binding protein